MSFSEKYSPVAAPASGASVPPIDDSPPEMALNATAITAASAAAVTMTAPAPAQTMTAVVRQGAARAPAKAAACPSAACPETEVRAPAACPAAAGIGPTSPAIFDLGARRGGGPARAGNDAMPGPRPGGGPAR